MRQKYHERQNAFILVSIPREAAPRKYNIVAVICPVINSYDFDKCIKQYEAFSGLLSQASICIFSCAATLYIGLCFFLLFFIFFYVHKMYKQTPN